MQGGLTTVVLLITDKAHAPVERFVFDLQSVRPVVPNMLSQNHEI